MTHGFANGLERRPAEKAELDRLGAEHQREIADAVRRHGIDCNWEKTGELTVANAEHEARRPRAARRVLTT